jgi:hypothetical protein
VIWYRPVGSNHAPPAYRAGALPAELDRRLSFGQGRLGSNQGHPASEAGVLPLNYTPNWRFPSVSSGALRVFNPALSPDQLGKRVLGAPGVDSNARPPAYKAGALPAELRGAYVSWYSVMVSNHRPPVCKTGALPTELTEHGRRGRARTCSLLVKSQLLSAIELRAVTVATPAGFEPAPSRWTGEHSCR